MKYFICIILLYAVTIMGYAQKTKRITVSDYGGLNIIGSVTEQLKGRADTVFMMFAQNAKYKQIVELITVTHGTLKDINSLLDECMKFLPESEGTSMPYKGNTLVAMGDGRILLFGTGDDSDGYVLLNKATITKVQSDIKAFLRK